MTVPKIPAFEPVETCAIINMVGKRQVLALIDQVIAKYRAADKWGNVVYYTNLRAKVESVESSEK